MPRPGYIICSQYGALDQYTNAVGAFNIIEVITIRPADVQPPEGARLKMRVVASWVREPGDAAGQVFDGQIVASFLNETDQAVIELSRAEFDQFSFEKRAHRLILPEMPMPEVPGPGLLLIESRVRRAGTDEWTCRQTYPIVLEMVERATAPAPPHRLRRPNKGAAPRIGVGGG
jgi:hypothetical protein